MTETTDERPSPASAEITEDDRRQEAAEINRKRAEDEWNANKQGWIRENFPEKRNPS